MRALDFWRVEGSDLKTSPRVSIIIRHRLLRDQRRAEVVLWGICGLADVAGKTLADALAFRLVPACLEDGLACEFLLLMHKL